MRKLENLTGEKFNRLTVVSFEKTEKGKTYWNCLCECGNTTIAVAYKLKDGSKKSCGCIRKEKSVSNLAKRKTHGMSYTHFHRAWRNMKDRCFNENSKSYQWYGAIGITVCEKWLTFENFKDDMFNSYNDHVKEHGEGETTLDRIDPFKNYSPDNCRWATKLEQRKNKR